MTTRDILSFVRGDEQSAKEGNVVWLKSTHDEVFYIVLKSYEDDRNWPFVDFKMAGIYDRIDDVLYISCEEVDNPSEIDEAEGVICLEHFFEEVVEEIEKTVVDRAQIEALFNYMRTVTPDKKTVDDWYSGVKRSPDEREVIITEDIEFSLDQVLTCIRGREYFVPGFANNLLYTGEESTPVSRAAQHIKNGELYGQYITGAVEIPEELKLIRKVNLAVRHSERYAVDLFRVKLEGIDEAIQVYTSGFSGRGSIGAGYIRPRRAVPKNAEMLKFENIEWIGLGHKKIYVRGEE